MRNYRVDYLPNGLIRVFEYATKSTTCFHGDGSYRHGPMRAATLADLLRTLDNQERIRQRAADDPAGYCKRRRCARRLRAWHRSRWATAAAAAPDAAPPSRRARPPLFRRQQRTAAADGAIRPAEAARTPGSLPASRSCAPCVEHPPAAPRRRSPWMSRILLSIAALCLVIGLWLALVQPWITAVTQPHARRGALWRASLPAWTWASTPIRPRRRSTATSSSGPTPTTPTTYGRCCTCSARPRCRSIARCGPRRAPRRSRPCRRRSHKFGFSKQ